MLRRMRQALISLNVAGNERSLRRDIRTAVVRAAAAARSAGGINAALDGIARLDAMKQTETATWVTPQALASGGGRFDACDLRHWLRIADLAGVAAVPAVPVLTLEEDELSAVAGTLEIPDSPALRSLRRAARHLLPEQGEGPGIEDDSRTAQVLAPDVAEKCYAAMDRVPEGWMVRHMRCGPSTLKTLAGCGVAGAESPDVAFGPDLVVGPGWVRNGNRRRVDVADARTMKVGVGQGPDAPHTWLARPWVPAARWTACEDPHRHGSAFAGKGFWPAEWRAFVEQGRVTGVSYYYPWAGEAFPADAAHALAVRDTAQRIVDAGIAAGAVPAFLDIEFARTNRQFAELGFQDRFPRDGFACCLDFIEVAGDGNSIEFLLLEGGPPMCLFGGAHPCGFVPVVKRTHKAEGVALKLPDGVEMMNPATWDVPTDGAILSWDEAVALAAGFARGESADRPGYGR